MTISIDELELAAAPGWQAVEQQPLGQWLLRAAGGFTGRANSALAAGDPGVPLTAAIEQVRRWYAARGLPAMISVPHPAGRPDDSPLDRLLAARGWTLRDDAATVMTAPAQAVVAAAGQRAEALTIRFGPAPDQAWLGRYHYRGQQLPPVALRLLTSAPWQEFASVLADGETIAIGRVAGHGNWAGLTAIEVDPQRRRLGLGSLVTVALAGRAARRGLPNLYLQVAEGNSGARALYRRLGFTDHHGYRYRIGPGTG
jgi:ribosomal protein S18 acetylase RimI-like enzyme